LNDDIKVERNCLKQLTDFLDKNPKVGAVQPLLLNWDGQKIESTGLVITYGSLIATKNLGKPFKNHPYKGPIEVLGTGGGCSVFPTNVIKKVGMFDENFFPAYFEDADISLRLRKANYKCYLLPEAIMYHKHYASFKKIHNTARKAYHRNHYLFLRKHGDFDMWAKTILYFPLVAGFFTLVKREKVFYTETFKFISSLIRDSVVGKN